ncbi:FAD-binding domain-containing protein [Pleomassaria siparia CBS 279.74]|uniref:FAD-binding domain-containing protein n=1 Tax=Pleomassaria siparia CBS 279.74 TaxID=1314801 RepID=A0A6G1JUQ3_9PLEO|nr:FAD-binding domain-containing protein [Pleomassaria siparia CBS 279.74]
MSFTRALVAISACKVFQTMSPLVLPGQVFLPNSSVYNESVNSYFAAFEREVVPECIIKPNSSADVSVIMTASVAANTKLAVRGGGHTMWAGAANLQGGATVDLRNIKGVVLSNDNTTVSVGAGETWGSVYEKLIPLGLMVAGGRMLDVGVAGLTLGGGLSYFTGKVGFVADTVTNFEIVLASGQVVNANKDTNTDLFAALKGGSNNFGIVTKIDYPVFAHKYMWGGMSAFQAPSEPELFKAFTDFATAPTGDVDAQVILSVGFDTSIGVELSVASQYYTKQVEVITPPPSLAPFSAIQPQVFSSLRSDTILGFVAEQNAYNVPGARQLFFSATFKPDAALQQQIVEKWRDIIEPLKTAEGLAIYLVFQTLTKEMLQKSAASGANSFGLDTADGPIVSLLINPVWKSQADDSRIIAALTELVAAVDTLATAAGKYSKYRYLNYSFGTQNPIDGYGEASKANLKAVSKKYDPTQFFQSNVPGGFKLS